MSLSKLTLSFCVFALTLASAASGYRVTLSHPAMIGNTELKPGDYTIEMDGDKAIFRTGNKPVETAAAKVETGDQKYSRTVIRYSNGDGRYHIQEIQLGGTKTKLASAAC